MNKKFSGYLFVSDMDGTILDDKSKISSRNLEAIHSFIKDGGLFTIATGRTVDSLGRYIGKLPVTVPVVLYNGAKLYDYESKSTIYESYVENEVKDTVKNFKNFDSTLGIEIYTEEKIFIYSSCNFTKRFFDKGYDVIFDMEGVWEKNWTKALIVGEEEKLDDLEGKNRSALGNANIVRSGENYLEILPKNVTKGSGVLNLCKYLKIDKNHVIAVGDNMNDLEMITNVGYGFCIQNGNKKLLEKAQYKCPSNNENPMEYIVDWLYKNL